VDDVVFFFFSVGKRVFRGPTSLGASALGRYCRAGVAEPKPATSDRLKTHGFPNGAGNHPRLPHPLQRDHIPPRVSKRTTRSPASGTVGNSPGATLRECTVVPCPSAEALTIGGFALQVPHTRKRPTVVSCIADYSVIVLSKTC
jgi:hypothetical protein